MQDDSEGEEESKSKAEDQMCEDFGGTLRQALGGCEKLPDDWVTTATDQGER